MSGSTAVIPVQVAGQLKALIPGFLGNRAKDLAAARTASAAADWAGLRSMGHRLYGTAASYGFHGLGDIGRALEAAAEQSDADAVQRALDAWASYLAAVRVEYI